MEKLKSVFKKSSILLTLLLVLSLMIPANVLSLTQITKTADASTIKLNKKSITMYDGDKVNLKILGTTAKVTWKSSNKAIARVTSYGNVYGEKVGEATITATVNKKKYTCKVKVKMIIDNEPDFEARILESDYYKNSITVLIIDNTGDFPITFNMDGYVLNDGYSTLSLPVSIFDSEDANLEYLESIEVESGELAYIWYRTDDGETDQFWLDDETNLSFDFTYDDIEFTGFTNLDGNFRFAQGIVE